MSFSFCEGEEGRGLMWGNWVWWGYDRSIVPTDYDALETLFKGAVKEKQKFERLVVSKEKLLEMFAVRPFLSFSSPSFIHSLPSLPCLIRLSFTPHHTPSSSLRPSAHHSPITRNSTTSTKSTSSTPKSPTEPARRSIAADQ